MQIVAVTFLEGNYSTYHLKNAEAGKVYFYIDPYGLVRGDIGLVHNGRELGLVKIARVVDASNEEACARVTKPILARVTWHADKLKGISDKLTEFLARTEEDRIQRAVDKALGLGKSLLEAPFNHNVTVSGKTEQQLRDEIIEEYTGFKDTKPYKYQPDDEIDNESPF